MPAPKDPEFRRRAVEFARLGRSRSPRSRGISGSLSLAFVVGSPRQTSTRASERVSRVMRRPSRSRLRRENRAQAMEIEILQRASVYFARENVLPNRVPARS